MIKEARGFGSTIDEARENAVANLNAGADDDIQFEIIAMPKKKTLGLFGGSKAEVRVYVEVPDKAVKNDKKQTKKPVKAEKKAEDKKAPAENREKKKPTAAPSRALDGFGEAVDADKLDPQSRSAKAVAYLKNILNSLGCTDISVKVAEKENAALITLDGEGLGVVIGHRGETLDALQYLTGLAANNGGGYYKVTLNIGDYREKREETLRNLAVRVSEQVLKTGRSRSLEPMNPYERRIIHTAVQEIDGVVSSSFGEGNARRVVIGVEGGEMRPPRRPRNDRDRRSAPRRSNTVSSVPSREPKKDSDLPLYGKIN